jgi:hypothetical protein
MMDYFNVFMTWFSLALLTCAVLCKVSTTFEYYFKIAFLYGVYVLTGTLLIPHGNCLSIIKWNSTIKENDKIIEIVHAIVSYVKILKTKT